MKKSILTMLEEIQVEKDLLEAKGDMDMAGDTGKDSSDDGKTPVDNDMDDEDEEKEEKISDHLPHGKGHYSSDDLREIIDYVRDLIKKEVEDDDDGDKKEEPDDIGEVGLDLIYEYADLLPETVINQLVTDLTEMFEIEDTMLESIVTEGSAFFNKSKKGPAAKAAAKQMRAYYRKNKAAIMKRNKKWRNSEIGKKIAALHHKIFKTGMSMGKIKGKRVVHQL
jgi:hypothetical protein